MSIFWMLIIGLVVGGLAKLPMQGKDNGGMRATMAIGVVGALLGGWAGSALGWDATTATAGFIGPLLGALVLLLGYRLVIGPPRWRSTG